MKVVRSSNIMCLSLMALIGLSLFGCTTSGEDIFRDFNTRTESDSTSMSQFDSTKMSLILNLEDTIMEYEVEEINVNL